VQPPARKLSSLVLGVAVEGRLAGRCSSTTSRRLSRT
jgi:hypothetical protein